MYLSGLTTPMRKQVVFPTILFFLDCLCLSTNFESSNHLPVPPFDNVSPSIILSSAHQPLHSLFIAFLWISLNLMSVWSTISPIYVQFCPFYQTKWPLEHMSMSMVVALPPLQTIRNICFPTELLLLTRSVAPSSASKWPTIQSTSHLVWAISRFHVALSHISCLSSATFPHGLLINILP